MREWLRRLSLIPLAMRSSRGLRWGLRRGLRWRGWPAAAAWPNRRWDVRGGTQNFSSASRLVDLGLDDTDNKGAHDLSYNPEFHARVKHIKRRHFYVRDMVEDHEIVVPLIRTDVNPADFFTKPMSTL